MGRVSEARVIPRTPGTRTRIVTVTLNGGPTRVQTWDDSPVKGYGDIPRLGRVRVVAMVGTPDLANWRISEGPSVEAPAVLRGSSTMPSTLLPVDVHLSAPFVVQSDNAGKLLLFVETPDGPS